MEGSVGGGGRRPAAAEVCFSSEGPALGLRREEGVRERRCSGRRRRRSPAWRGLGSARPESAAASRPEAPAPRWREGSGALGDCPRLRAPAGQLPGGGDPGLCQSKLPIRLPLFRRR